jgi:hypothetical protein
MRNKTRLIPVVLMVTCLMLFSIPLAGHAQMKLPPRIKATLSASPVSYSGTCPALITFRGKITVSRPTTVQYKFIRSDNAQAPIQTLKFAKAGTQEVSTTWQLGGTSLPTYIGWQAIEVISPVSVQSNKASFNVRCAEAEQPIQPGVIGTQLAIKLPDLTIEDIWLNNQCFVVVKAKNNGPGTVPDTVWTAHTPDSSAVYLQINGKNWGGETIWHFDPAKNLQRPGGTATMTSNLKVSGTVTINATIDGTKKVTETNENNNQIDKILTCRPDTKIQPQPGVVLQPGVTAQPSMVKEDCVSFNPATTTVQQIQGRWKVVDGSHWLFDFGNNKDEADKTLAIIKHYRMDQSCFVGRPHPSFSYMLVSGASPAGAFSGEDCVSFNPITTTVKEIDGDWKVVDGKYWMFSFGFDKAGAEQTRSIIKKYGFTRSCFVGRPGPSFTYMRK